MFAIGQQVVCTYDGPWYDYRSHIESATNNPRCGMIYTIRGFYTPPVELLGLLFEEIPNPPYDCGSHGMREASFDSRHFRPVKKTRIDVFTARLNPTPTKELERV